MSQGEVPLLDSFAYSKATRGNIDVVVNLLSA